MTLNTPSGAAEPSSALGTSPDVDWEVITVLLEPAPLIPVNPSDSRSLTPAQQEIARLRQAGLQAKAFYSRYPKHARAGDAKKVELLTGLQCIQLGAADTDGVVTRAQAYRNDRGNSTRDRFEMALALENLSASKSPNGQSEAALLSAREDMLDRLHAEFGPTAELSAGYAALLLSDPAQSVRVADKVQSKNFAAVVKQDAKTLANSVVANGTPIELSLATLDGNKVVFQSVTTPTVVVFWNTNALAELDALNQFKGKVPASVQFVYVGLGTNHPSEAVVKARAPFAGIFCGDSTGIDGAAAKTLGVSRPPYVAIISQKGRLMASGPIEQLQSLLTRVAK